MLALRIRPAQARNANREAGLIALRRSSGQCPVRHHPSVPERKPKVHVGSFGKDAVDGWLDLTKLVAGGGSSKTPYDDFASAIGRDIYVDIAGWHLYLRDMGTGVPGSTIKMSQALAQQLGPQLSRGLRESDVEVLLKKIPVKLGAGKLKASLYEVMPSMCVGDLVRLCDEYARR